MRPGRLYAYSGQALVEGVVILLALVALWASATWLFRLQDMALQAEHASRYAAFAAARGIDETVIGLTSRQRYFSGSAHQWRTLSGQQWLTPERSEVSVALRRYEALVASAHPGGGNGPASILQAQWGVGDSLLTQARVLVQPRALRTGVAPALGRQQFILVGAGHGVGDAQVTNRLAQSALGWHAIVNSSTAQGEGLAAVLGPIDKGWGRPEPEFDWLARWEGVVPPWHMASEGGQ